MNFRSIIESAIERILYILVSICIDLGITEKDFADIVKKVYVKSAAEKLEEQIKEQKAKAEQAAEKQGRRASELQGVSRTVVHGRVTYTHIALLTGIPRQFVKKYLEQQLSDEGDDGWYRNRCGQVLTDWWRDTNYTDKKGFPLTLAENDEIARTNGESVSFEKLVKDSDSGLSYHAVLDELVGTGSVELLKDGRLKVLKKRYERTGISPEALSEAADRIFAHSQSINAKLRGTDPASDVGEVYTLTADVEKVPVAMRLIRDMMSSFLSSAQSAISRAEAKPGSEAKTVKITVGAYATRGDAMAESKYFAKAPAEEKQAANE